jgi:DNA-3-methyladenine glycosylase I
MPSPKRCSWAVDDQLLIEYHDKEWGVPLQGDDELFERLTLEIFQAGLSWRLILQKRQAFRKAFAEFSIERVASFGEKDVARLLKDKGIIRNRLKIEATIENARRLKGIIAEHGSFADYIEGLGGNIDDINKELKRSFKFMGPMIAECFLQSIGKLDGAHEPGCAMARKSSSGRRKK